MNAPNTRLAAVFLFALLWAALAALAATRYSAHGSLWALHPSFWIDVSVGVGAMSISGWVWALRPRDLPSALFALSGVATLAFTLGSAVGWAPGVTLPPALFMAAAMTNAIGATGFGAVMIVLFLVYPVRLPRWRTIAVASTAGFGAWTTLTLMGVMPGWSTGHLITLTEMIGICIAIGAQYFATKGDPKARAVLTWFGLSVLIGAGGFIALNAVPAALGFTVVLDASYAFLFFLVIYIGMAAGLRRYRLFELGDWAFRILFYMVGAALLILVDALLIMLVSVEPGPAFGVSLLAVAFLYLPLRDAAARLILRRGRPDRDAMFHAVVDVAFGPSSRERAGQWTALVRRLFQPLECAPAAATVAEPEIREDGLELVLPAVADAPALTLRYPWNGRGLFGPPHLETARQLIKLMAHAEASRKAYDRGVAEERSRIARDMHDNIGSHLLSALHSQDNERKDLLIRETLTDLRDIVNDASRPDLSFDETLAELRMETAERLAAVDVALDWTVEAQNAPPLEQATAHALRSIVREAANNVIKHAEAKRMSLHLSWRGGDVSVLIEDDGKGFDAGAAPSGAGLENMRSRMLGLRGVIEITAGVTGTRIAARFPAPVTG